MSVKAVSGINNRSIETASEKMVRSNNDYNSVFAGKPVNPVDTDGSGIVELMNDEVMGLCIKKDGSIRYNNLYRDFALSIIIPKGCYVSHYHVNNDDTVNIVITYNERARKFRPEDKKYIKENIKKSNNFETRSVEEDIRYFLDKNNIKVPEYYKITYCGDTLKQSGSPFNKYIFTNMKKSDKKESSKETKNPEKNSAETNNDEFKNKKNKLEFKLRKVVYSDLPRIKNNLEKMEYKPFYVGFHCGTDGDYYGATAGINLRMPDKEFTPFVTAEVRGGHDNSGYKVETGLEYDDGANLKLGVGTKDGTRKDQDGYFDVCNGIQRHYGFLSAGYKFADDDLEIGCRGELGMLKTYNTDYKFMNFKSNAGEDPKKEIYYNAGPYLKVNLNRAEIGVYWGVLHAPKAACHKDQTEVFIDAKFKF